MVEEQQIEPIYDTEGNEVIEGQASDEPEEEEEQAEEESGEQPEESAQEQEKPHKDMVEKALFNKTRREAFRYLNKIQELQAELAAEREEAAKLRHLNDVSTKVAFDNYEIAAKERMDRARDMHQSALESGDNKSITDAQIAVSKAVNEYEKIMSARAQQEVEAENQRAMEELNQRYYQQHQQQQPQKYIPRLSEENYLISEDWFQKNQWYQNGNPNQDIQKTQVANVVFDNIDNHCRQNGLEHMIGSQEYFNAAEAQIAAHMAQYYPQQQQRQAQDISGMQQRQGYQQPQARQQQASYSPSTGRATVAPARGRTPGAVAGGRQPQAPLSRAERDMIQRLGVSEATYRASKEKSMKSDYLSDQIAQYTKGQK
jgi:hypothetical protein